MKALPALLLLCLSVVRAQNPAPAPAPATLPDLPGETVIAVFEDGSKLTMGEFRSLLTVLPPEQQSMIVKNPKEFVRQYDILRKLAKMAEAEGIDKTSPLKEQLAFQRLQALANNKIMRVFSLAQVPPEEITKYYQSNRERYKQVKVKALYVAFSADEGAASGGKKALNEKQALDKITKLLAEIRGGADFVKVVKENSDDETSRAKDGDFLTVRVSDNLPDAMRNAVFQLKEGEVSEPVRQPGGFYVFRAEKVTYRPEAEVRDEIFTALQQQHGAAELRQLDDDTKVEFPNPAFGATPTPAPAAAPAAPAQK